MLEKRALHLARATQTLITALPICRRDQSCASVRWLSATFSHLVWRGLSCRGAPSVKLLPMRARVPS